MLFFRKILSFILFIWVLVSTALNPLTVRGDVLRINTDRQYQKMISWGTSACWWSQQMRDSETADEIARLLYGENGLNLNVYRFNIGAGSADNPSERISIEKRKSESFYVYDKEKGEYIYDFSRDASSVMMMDKALKAGADSIIMFCNSPHYSMTVSGQAGGGLEAAQSNLPRENYRKFVDYVLTVADHFYNEGYPVTYISPINEPQWDWGGESVSQEGCHFTAEEAVELLELFAVTMQERHTPYGLMGIESGELSPKYYEYVDLFAKSKILMSYCDTFCAHSYWIDNDVKQKIQSGERVKALMPELNFEMSEWCELPCKLDAQTVDSALYMSTVIAEDLKYLGVNSWSSWTACEVSSNPRSVHGSDRFFAVSPDMSDFAIMKRYYAFRHFSQFIPAGSIRVQTVEGKKLEDIISVAYLRPDGKIALVITNNSESDYSINLKDFSVSEMYVTDENRNCEQAETNTPTDVLSVGAKSIVTAILIAE